MAEIKDNTDKITKKPSRPSPLNSESGFTLIEALIALAVLTIGILALNAMQVSAIRGNSTSNSLSVATSVARDGFERLMSVDVSVDVNDPLVDAGTHIHTNAIPIFVDINDNNDFPLPGSINDVRWAVVDWTITDGIDNDGGGVADETDERGIKEITLSVSYTVRGIARTVETTFLKHEIL